MFEGISPLHLLVVLVIALIILGPGKLPEVGAALGKSIRDFRRAATDIRETTSLDPSLANPSVPVSTPVEAAPTPAAAVGSTVALAGEPDPREGRNA